MILVRVGKRNYFARDESCKQRRCWAPGEYQHRGATGASGSRNTGAVSRVCLTHIYQGCPKFGVASVVEGQTQRT